MTEKQFKRDQLGSRLKGRFESRFQTYLPRRSFFVIRIDGKSFSNYTSKCERPYDFKLMKDMDETALYLVKNIEGSVCAHSFSDEISIIITDFAKTTTEGWFDLNVQKMVSVSASLATAYFNMLRYGKTSDKLAIFDSRVFCVPDRIEICNYLVWRSTDASRNSLQMLARSLYSHKELHGKTTPNLHDLIHAKNKNWNDLPSRCKRGSFIMKKDEKWQIVEAPIFQQEPEFLQSVIPTHGY